MENVIDKSEFVLTPYMKSNDFRAAYQILNTVIPYFLLWFLAVKAVAISVWLLPPLIALMTLFSLRCFSLMHDCGHYSLFRSKKVNRTVGFMLGVINAIPQYVWSKDHAYHHKTNGAWERYRGVADFLSTEEFSNLSPRQQKIYEVLRQPYMVFPGGFFYLALQPRLALIAGICGFFSYSLTCLRTKPGMNVSEIVSSYPSKHWKTKAEFWDLLLNNICVVGSWIALSYVLGATVFFSIYSSVLTLSAMIFIAVFFMQHIFEGTYAHRTEGWNYITGAIEGSSYLKLHPILNWFTADIGYHNVHHLSERIPNYHLKACHDQNSHLLTTVKTLGFRDAAACSKLILWDAESNRLVSIEGFRQAERLNLQVCDRAA
jgi:omega-6 fatty acid desaturase (delta-12 desaturase)